MTKIFHAFAINIDQTMIDKKRMTSAVTRTSTLTDELGRIDIVFSDKTGTLTKNKMKFFCCSVEGKKYFMSKDKIFSKELYGEIKKNNVNVVEFLKLTSLCHTVLPDFPDCEIKHVHDMNCDCF